MIKGNKFGKKDDPLNDEFKFRCKKKEKDAWKKAAKKCKTSMGEVVRKLLNNWSKGI